jgi:5-methylthioadenosine/S-adenosylhomocysteine deaminase
MSANLAPAQFIAPTLLLEPAQLMLRDGPVTEHAVVISDGKFSDIGPCAAVQSRHPDLTPLPLPGTLLMPGFVDAHHHLTQTFGKALAFGEPSEIFRRIWVPLEGVLDDELVYLTAKAAALESLRGGFTTVVDAGTRAEGSVSAIARAVQEAGLRCVLGLICNDLGAGGEVADRDAILNRAEDHLGRHDSLVHPSLAISIPEAATPTMLCEISALAARSGAVFQSHVNEHLAAVERSLMQVHRRPLEHLYDLGALGPHVLIAHSTLVTPTELAMLKETDTAIAYNPVASQWKGNAVAPANLMQTLGIRFGIGTDGTRSDGFRLVDAAEATQRLAFGMATGDFSCGGGWTWLEHATTLGADVSGLGKITGEIAPGLAADCLLVDIDVPEFSPSWDLTWELVRLGNRDQIVAVFVDGRLRLWRGWPVDWDGRALMHEIAERARDAVQNAPIQRIHPVSREHRLAATDDRGGRADTDQRGGRHKVSTSQSAI